jgi:hypothetical protein
MEQNKTYIYDQLMFVGKVGLNQILADFWGDLALEDEARLSFNII